VVVIVAVVCISTSPRPASRKVLDQSNLRKRAILEDVSEAFLKLPTESISMPPNASDGGTPRLFVVVHNET
jgi:hypothetical protein